MKDFISLQEFIKYLESENLSASFYPESTMLTSGKEVLGVGYEWVIGGLKGRNCWAYRDEKIEADFEPNNDEVFVKIFNHFCPFINDEVVYNEMVKKIKEKEIEYESHMCNYDYYGNYDDFGYKFVSIESLYNFVKEYYENKE